MLQLPHQLVLRRQLSSHGLGPLPTTGTLFCSQQSGNGIYLGDTFSSATHKEAAWYRGRSRDGPLGMGLPALGKATDGPGGIQRPYVDKV